MDAEKRKILVREINHWRRSKLLPEHYCDFLMNLYMDESTPKPASIMGVSASSIANSSWKIWLVILAVITALALSALNFNSFGMPMQIGISSLFVIVCYVFGYLQISKSPVVSYLLCGVSSFALLLLGLYLMDMYEVTSSYSYIGYLAFCSVVWLINGVAGRMGIFQLCGWIGLVGTYGWLLLQKLDTPGWFSLEISWIPVSIVLIWIAWLAHHTNKQAAGVLLLVGGLVWFAPEAMTFLTDVEMSSRVIQLSFTGKLVTAGAAFFMLRKKWVEWVV